MSTDIEYHKRPPLMSYESSEKTKSQIKKELFRKDKARIRRDIRRAVEFLVYGGALLIIAVGLGLFFVLQS